MANQEPATLNLCRTRGDTFPFTLVITVGGVAVDLTSYTAITLTVDPSSEPPDATDNLFANVGVITDAPNGKVTFTLSVDDADQTPGEYFHDIAWVDASSFKRTFARGTYIVQQDIGKG